MPAVTSTAELDPSLPLTQPPLGTICYQAFHPNHLTELYFLMVALPDHTHYVLIIHKDPFWAQTNKHRHD